MPRAPQVIYPHRKPLTKDEERNLFHHIRHGESPEIALAACEELIEANLGLVMQVARNHLWSKVSLNDLFQSGIPGLYKAISKFNPERGVRFCTYAAWWIRSAIQRSVYDTARTIRLPISAWNTRQDILRAESVLASQSADTDDDAIAAIVGKRVSEVRFMRETMLQDPVSLDQPLAEDMSSRLSDNIPDTESPSPDEVLYGRQTIERLREAMAQLTPYEREILVQRFGNGVTLEATAPLVKHLRDGEVLSREGIRINQMKALQKLRALM